MKPDPQTTLNPSISTGLTETTIGDAMSDPQTTFTVDQLAAIIHDAKIRFCWDKTKWEERRAKEPWPKPNRASPNQPWHDIAIAQAEAVLEAING